MDLYDFFEQIGEWVQNENLVKGVLITGGAALTVLLTSWRVLRGKKDRIIANINAPAGTKIRFESGEDTGKVLIQPATLHTYNERYTHGIGQELNKKG